jgi:Uma2 family endonuclease
MATAVRFTYQDYLQLPEDRRYEIVNGELYIVPAPTPAHQAILRNLELALHRYVTDADLGIVLQAPCDVLLSAEDVVQPDVFFISTNRQSIMKEQYIDGAPDLVVEILSPATAARDRGVKLKLYERAGVLEYWLVSPEARTVEVLTLSGTSYARMGLYGAEDTLASPLLTDLAITVRDIF